MLSFRVQEAEAQAATRWATALGIDRSDLLREALHRHLVSLAAATELGRTPGRRSMPGSSRCPQSPTGGPPRSGLTGMRHGEVWFAATPGGDRPVLVLTRDPVAARIGAVVVAALTRTERGLVSELRLSRARDGVPTDCVVSFDNLHTVPRASLRRRITRLGAPRMAEVCRTLRDALGC